MPFLKDLIKSSCSDMEISLSDEMLAQFETYAALLKDWNQKINLTSIVDDQGIAVKHFIDSLTILKFTDLPAGASLIDVGTGAGFPGLPLKIARPDMQVTLLDSLNKRVNFLNAVTKELNIHAPAVHARAEDAAKSRQYRETFDFAVSRAVAKLPVLCEICLPFVKTGGYFIAMKGPDPKEEVAEALPALAALSGEITGVHNLKLPDESERTVIMIKKISQISPKYPRSYSKIVRAPFK